MALTPEEKEELLALENEQKADEEAAADAAKRQHIDALKLRKRMAIKHGVHGDDFAVVETTQGNFVVRRPLEEQADMIGDNADSIDAQKGFALDCLIEPDESVAKAILVKYPGIRNVLVIEALRLVGRRREQDAKK